MLNFMNQKRFVALTAICLLGCSSVSKADLQIDVRKGVAGVIPLILCGVEDWNTEMTEVVKNDLASCGFFEIIPFESSSASKRDLLMGRGLDAWNARKGSRLAVCHVSSEGSRWVATVRFFDVCSKRFLGEVLVKGSQENPRLFAHKLSNSVYKKLTGEDGYFHTKLFYTCQYGPATNKIRRIAQIDIDGANCRVLTPVQQEALIPKGTKTGNKVTYIIKNKNSGKYRIHVLDMATKALSVLPDEGCLISPQFSPSGNEVIYAKISPKGESSLAIYNPSSGSTRPFSVYTGGQAFQVSPSYSPDGRMVVFSAQLSESTRPKIYVKPASGGSPVCISRGQGSYFCPVWSPDGRWIACIKKSKGNFYLCVMTPSGDQERAISQAFLLDQPTWAPNSRWVACSFQTGRYKPFHIMMAHISGRFMRTLNTSLGGVAHEGNHPSWCGELQD